MGEPTFSEILLQTAEQDVLAYCKLKTIPEIGDALRFDTTRNARPRGDAPDSGCRHELGTGNYWRPVKSPSIGHGSP